MLEESLTLRKWVSAIGWSKLICGRDRDVCKRKWHFFFWYCTSLTCTPFTRRSVTVHDGSYDFTNFRVAPVTERANRIIEKKLIDYVCQMKDEYRRRLIVVAGQLRSINHSSILQSLHHIRQSFWGSTFSLTLRRLMYFVKPCNRRHFNEWPVRVSEFGNQKTKLRVWTANNNYPNKAEFPDARPWCGGRPTT